MGQPEECARLVGEGNSPAGIALALGISTSSVIQYLFVAIGKHKTRISDVLLSIPSSDRDAIDKAAEAAGTDYWSDVSAHLQRSGIQLDRETLQLYLRNRPALVGELYVFLSELELSLHARLEAILKAVFHSASGDWWAQGVPAKIRDACETRHEKDPAPSGHPYQYTDFGHIWGILDRNWLAISPWLPPPEVSQKEVLHRDLSKANYIRNRVMHPVHRYTPSQEDLEFVRDLSTRLAPNRWPPRKEPRTK